MSVKRRQGTPPATNRTMKGKMSAAAALALAMLAGGAGAAIPGAAGAGPASPGLAHPGPTHPGQATFRGHQLAAHARLSLGRARAAALKVRPGALVDQELEKEAGGSGLRYSFDILSGGKIYEVGVDAKTGRILEDDVETAAEGAAEH